MAGIIEQTQSFEDLYQNASKGLSIARTAVTLITLARRGTKYFEFMDSTPELKQAYENALAGSTKDLDNLAVMYLARTSITLKRIDEYNGKTESQTQKAQELQNKFDKLYNSLEEITKPDADETEINGEGRN